MKKEIIPKRKSRGFGKDVYLLGEDSEGILYWLEEPSWDCGWYWGFGYVETYTNNRNPGHSKDINSHQHIEGFLGDQRDGTYVHNLYDSPVFEKPTFNEKEGWQLTELFQQFYLLNRMGEFTHRERPGCHVTTSPVDHGDLITWNRKINEEMIPRITKEILRILSPEEEL